MIFPCAHALAMIRHDDLDQELYGIVVGGNFFGRGRSPKLLGRGAARGSGTKTLRATNAYVFVVHYV